MTRLQSVQNAAARLMSGVRQYDHITPLLHQLYWLPVQKLVVFTLVTIRCLAWLWLTWSLTVICLLKKVVIGCILPTQGLVSSGGPTATVESAVSCCWALAQGCGTAPKAVEQLSNLS